MKKILLIQTGGTIGSEERCGVIGTAGGALSGLCGDRDVSFDIVRPFTILSENLSPSHWEMLIQAVDKGLGEGYDGIIITHGSDTLAYTSAMMGLCFGGSSIPIVITAANKVPADPKSNARVNMTAAADLISKSDGGVFTVYRNENSENAQVWLPTRLIGADRFGDNFSSPDGHPLAEIGSEGNIISLMPGLWKGEKLVLRGRDIGKDIIAFKRRVLVLYPYPSVDHDSVMLTADKGAVLLVTYHSGTVPESSKRLVDRCKERDIPVYLCSVKAGAAALYETTDSLLSGGVRALYDITTEAAYAKLLLALNLGVTDTDRFMREEIYYEYAGRREEDDN